MADTMVHAARVSAVRAQKGTNLRAQIPDPAGNEETVTIEFDPACLLRLSGCSSRKDLPQERLRTMDPKWVPEPLPLPRQGQWVKFDLPDQPTVIIGATTRRKITDPDEVEMLKKRLQTAENGQFVGIYQRAGIGPNLNAVAKAD